MTIVGGKTQRGGGEGGLLGERGNYEEIDFVVVVGGAYFLQNEGSA